MDRSFPVGRHDTNSSVRVHVAPDATPTAALDAYWHRISGQQQQHPPNLILEERDPLLQGGKIG